VETVADSFENFAPTGCLLRNNVPSAPLRRDGGKIASVA